MQGEVAYLYAFDVANEIAVAKVGEVLSGKPFPYEVRTDHTFPKDVPLYKPLSVEITEFATTLRGRPLKIVVRVYEVGVISIAARVGFSAERLDEIRPYHQPQLDDGKSLDELARQLCDEVCRNLAQAGIPTSPPTEPEAYTVFCLTDLDGETDVAAWAARQRASIAELLAEAAPGGLAESQVVDVLRIQRSYFATDWVVVDWDAALIVDLKGYVDDVLYVLELANLQLEEYRVLDRRLDRGLDRAYDDLRRRRYSVLGTYSKTLDTLRLMQVDVATLNDEVTHITKFLGDWYLARVYLGAAERFHLGRWRQSVEDRLGKLDQLYTVVNSDINNRRMVVLEVMIVVLFCVDLVMLFFHR